MPLGIELLFQPFQQRPRAAVFQFAPVNAMFTDTVVVHHRTAEANGFFTDDLVERIVVLVDFLFPAYSQRRCNRRRSTCWCRSDSYERNDRPYGDVVGVGTQYEYGLITLS